nr:unnamed protein product [Digitaria exilis]
MKLELGGGKEIPRRSLGEHRVLTARCNIKALRGDSAGAHGEGASKKESVESLRKWRIKAGKAMLVLKTTIEEDLLEHIRDVETPKEAWETLGILFSKKNEARLQLLEKERSSCRIHIILRRFQKKFKKKRSKHQLHMKIKRLLLLLLLLPPKVSTEALLLASLLKRPAAKAFMVKAAEYTTRANELMAKTHHEFFVSMQKLLVDAGAERRAANKHRRKEQQDHEKLQKNH